MRGQKQQLAGHILGAAGRSAKSHNILAVTAEQDVHHLVHRSLIQLGKALLQIL